METAALPSAPVPSQVAEIATRDPTTKIAATIGMVEMITEDAAVVDLEIIATTAVEVGVEAFEAVAEDVVAGRAALPVVVEVIAVVEDVEEEAATDELDWMQTLPTVKLNFQFDASSSSFGCSIEACLALLQYIL
jgi:hypothetical protein